MSIDSPAASLEFEATPGDGELTYRFEFKLKMGEIPPDMYKDYKKAVDTMKELADEWIICTTGDDAIAQGEGSALLAINE